MVALAGSASGANGKIVFAKSDGSHSQLWIVNADGSGAVQVTTDAVDHYQPKWSPDGRKLAYTSYPTPTDLAHPAVYVASVSSTGVLGTPAQLASGSDPAWSADGTKLAFSHSNAIWTMNADGSGQTQLTHDAITVVNSSPTWAPDGTEIAYEHQILNGDYDIDAIKTDGSGTRRTIVGTGAFEGTPAWSPNGTTIAYDQATSASSGDDDIYTVAATGGTGAALVATAAFETQPQWSPDSTKIVYSSGSSVDVVAAGGGTPTAIATGSFGNTPDWQVQSLPTAFTVNTTADTHDANAGDGSCADSTGACSLRAAIEESNADCNTIAISVPSGTYALSLGTLRLTCAAAIVGAGARTTTVDRAGGAAAFRILTVSSGSIAASGVTISGGLADGTDAEPNPGVGGGIWIDSPGRLSITDSTVSGNRASVSGGGIDDDGTLTVTRTTIASNTGGFGGGIDDFGHNLAVTDSTITGNTVTTNGGAILTATATQLVSDTIVGSVFHQGSASTIDVTNSIVVGGCSGTITPHGHNLSDDATCGFDIQNANAQLGALQNNGGQTDTRAPASASPAVDAGDDATCPSVDQRNTARPQGAHCDLGSVELVPAAPSGVSASNSTVTASPTSVSADGSTAATVTVVLKDAAGSAVAGKTVSLSPSGGSGVSDGSGHVTFTVRDPNAETVVYTARDTTDGVTLTQTASVTFTAPPPQPPTIRIVATPTDPTTSQVVTLSAVVEEPGGATTTSYAWALGDGATETTATVRHRYAVAGTYVASVTVVDSAGASATARLSITVAAPPLSIGIDAIPGIAVAGQQEGLGIVIPSNQPGPQQVSWTFGDGSSASGSTRTTTHKYGSAGTFTVSVSMTDTAGHTLTATKSLVVAPAQVGPADAQRSTVEANPSSVVTADTATIVVTLHDAWGRPVRNAKVRLQPSSTHVTGPNLATTDGFGKAGFVVKDSHDEDVTFSAQDTTDSVQIAQTATVTWDAAAIQAAVTASPTSLPADQSSTTTITLTLTGPGGKPARNKMVQFMLESGVQKSSFTTNDVITDANGYASLALGGRNHAGDFLVDVNDLTDRKIIVPQPRPTIHFVAAPGGPADASMSTVAVSQRAVAVGDKSNVTVTVTLLNAAGGPVPGRAVTLQASSAQVNLPTRSATTDSNGTATFIAASPSAVTTTFTAHDAADALDIGPSDDVTFYEHVVDASTSSITVAPASVLPDGHSKATVTVTLRDAGGTPVSGIPVELVATGTAAIQPARATAGINGVATFAVTDTRVQQVTLSATAGGVAFGDATVAFTNQVPDPARSEVTASPDVVIADGTHASKIVVNVRNAQGQLLHNRVIDLQPAGGFSQMTHTGQTFTVKDATLESVTYTAVDVTDNNMTIGTVTVTFVRPVKSANSSITATPASAPADGQSVIAVTVTLRDSKGDPAVGRSVQLELVESARSKLIYGTHTTGSDGTAVYRLKSQQAVTGKLVADLVDEGITVGGGSSGVVIAFTASSGGVVSPTMSTVGASATKVRVGGSSTVTVQLRNASGGPVPGKSVTLRADTGNSRITPAAVTTDANGTVTFTVTDQSAESPTYTAHDATDGFAIVPTATIGFYRPAVDLAASSLNSAPFQVAADGASQATAVVTLVDQAGAPLAGRRVQLHADGSAVVTAAARTNATGTATFRVSDATRELVTLSATDVASGGTLAQTAEVSFTRAPSAATSFVSTDLANVADNGRAAATITVQLRDAQGQAVLGATAELVPNASSSARVTRVQAPDPADNRFRVTDGKAETVTFKAVDTNAGITVLQTVTVTFAPPAVSSRSFVSATSTSAPADGTEVTVTATFETAGGQAAAGKAVNLVTEPGSTIVLVPRSAVTDANGVVTFTLESRTVGEMAVAVVDVSDGSPQVQTKSLTIHFT